MISNTFFVTTLLFLGALLLLMGELRFLVPFRQLLLTVYFLPILGFATLLFVNLFAVFFAINRKLLLKDTGKKLAHLEKQLRTKQTISEELSGHLAD